MRVGKTPLADRAEFLVGKGRYRFDVMHIEPAATDVDPTGKTRGWGEGSHSIRPPALTEFVGSKIGSRIILVKPEYWIGSDPSCPICRSDRPLLRAAPRSGSIAAPRNAGTSRTTKRPMVCGCGPCPRLRSTPWSSSRSASKGSGSRFCEDRSGDPASLIPTSPAFASPVFIRYAKRRDHAGGYARPHGWQDSP